MCMLNAHKMVVLIAESRRPFQLMCCGFSGSQQQAHHREPDEGVENIVTLLLPCLITIAHKRAHKCAHL
jgi:hypothetical protein